MNNSTALGNTARKLACLTHLGGILGVFPSLIIFYVIQSKLNSERLAEYEANSELLAESELNSEFALAHATEAVNFQVTVAFIASTVYLALQHYFEPFKLTRHVFAPAILFLINLIFCIIAAVKARHGKAYRYPYSLRLF